MWTALIACLFIGTVLADRFTDFDSNRAWWTDLDTVGTSVSGYRRMCFVSGYDSSCDTSVNTWTKMRSIALPSTIETSYSGTVTAYSLCRDSDVGPNNYFYKLIVGNSCGLHWNRIAGVNLITDGTGWSDSFTVGFNTWYRRDFDVYLGPLDFHIIVPAGDLPPYPTSYSYAFSFVAYAIPV